MAGTTFRLTWYGEQVKNRKRAGAARGARDAAEHLLAMAQRIIPLEEGTLLRSGRVDSNGSQGRVGVSFGTEYAEVQHEREDYRHDPGRTDHYLSGPMATEQQVMLGIIAAAIRGALR